MFETYPWPIKSKSHGLGLLQQSSEKLVYKKAKLRTKPGCISWPFLYNIILEVLVHTLKHETRDKNIGQVEIKSSFVSNVIMYLENLRRINWKYNFLEFSGEFIYIQRQHSCILTTIQVRRCNDEGFIYISNKEKIELIKNIWNLDQGYNKI